MIISTVGEMIAFLKENFDQNTPILKSDISGIGYSSIIVTDPMVYGVKSNDNYGQPNYLDADYEYVDANKGDNGFLAVVL